MKKSFITGITGQDGSYLAELLLSKGYEIDAPHKNHDARSRSILPSKHCSKLGKTEKSITKALHLTVIGRYNHINNLS